MTPSEFAKSSATLGFAHNALDRLANARDDEAFQAEAAADPRARTLAVLGESVAVRRGAGGALDLWFGFGEAEALGRAGQRVFLGRDARGPAFAVQVETEAEEPLAGHDGLELLNLRQVAAEGSVVPDDLGALAEGKSLLSWHASHRFCGKCGAATLSSTSGWKRTCPACGLHHFPRTDPVVIMLATDGERCLLGRQPRFPAGMYSCLAGFLEPGETIEAAVRREIGEEAGIQCGAVTYLGCQPWPFPASLMIGCLVDAASTDIAIDAEELEDARWFTRAEVRAMLEGRHPEGLTCPMPMAIAHHIVLAWVDGLPG
jgi:NAD+ diphosphatase